MGTETWRFAIIPGRAGTVVGGAPQLWERQLRGPLLLSDVSQDRPPPVGHVSQGCLWLRLLQRTGRLRPRRGSKGQGLTLRPPTRAGEQGLDGDEVGWKVGGPERGACMDWGGRCRRGTRSWRGDTGPGRQGGDPQHGPPFVPLRAQRAPGPEVGGRGGAVSGEGQHWVGRGRAEVGGPSRAEAWRLTPSTYGLWAARRGNVLLVLGVGVAASGS